jgi:hypothetical protein
LTLGVLDVPRLWVHDLCPCKGGEDLHDRGVVEKFSVAEKRGPQRSLEMQAMQRFIRRFLCGICPAQKVIGNREYAPSHVVDSTITDHRAHVCPFILRSLQNDLFWIEESDLDDAGAIEHLLRSQIAQFTKIPPAHDCVAARAPAQPPTYLKTFLTFFPNVRDLGGSTDPNILAVHARLKPVFMDEGLMIGESFKTYQSHCVYDRTGGFNSLISTYPALAIRYMVWHDKRLADPYPVKYDRFFGNFVPPTTYFQY